MTTAAGRPRNHASRKKAGTGLERLAADYLRDTVDDRIDRRVKTGSKDKGDLANVRYLRELSDGSADLRGRVVVECKNTTRIALSTWAAEAETERINDEADVAVIVHKRHGRAAAGDQWVTMTLRDLATLLSGVRPAS